MPFSKLLAWHETLTAILAYYIFFDNNRNAKRAQWAAVTPIVDLDAV